VKVTSPVGEYEYLVKGVRREGASVVIDGGLCVWETTMTIEPADWAALARRAAAPLAVIGASFAAAAAVRRFSR
jgi:hypothetical protein